MDNMHKIAMDALLRIAAGNDETLPYVAAIQALGDIARCSVEADLERLLTISRDSGSKDEDGIFFDEWADIRDRWRARRGEAGMDAWQWWAGEIDGDLYASCHPTREAAVAWGKSEWPGTSFRIVEARLWNDEMDPIDDGMMFAATRNAETILITEWSNG